MNGWRETIVKREKPNSAWDGRGSGDKMILYHRSIDDFNSNYEHEYGLGIVVCHDGKIFAYRSYQFVSAKRYELEIADYKKWDILNMKHRSRH